jgi:tRNA dimethylallyltransferase
MRLTGDAPLLVILGPTASGKTALALTLAAALNGEIIGADSRQIYRHMDIGTAKPIAQQRARVPHHLIDMVAPDENLGLAQYQRMAYAAIDSVHDRGNLPLLVGGTGQYITAVVEGWSIPEVPPNPTLRAELEAYAAQHGPDALHARLAARDPAAAAAIDHRNVRRVVRALEVCIETDTPITELQRKQPPPYRIRQYGLALDRDHLRARADARFDAMMADGLLDEVRWLLDHGYDRSLPAMSGLGYAQLATHLQDGLPLAEAVASAKQATHDFIRRQITWFRGHDDGIIWLDAEEVDPAALIGDVRAWLEKV